MFIVYVYWFIHMLYKSFMAGQESSSFEWGRARLKKHGLPPHIHSSPTTSTAPASNTPTTTATSTPRSSFIYLGVCYDT